MISLRVRKLACGILVSCSVSTATAAIFEVRGNVSSDTVSFRSTAKLEFIEGKTCAIDGFFSFDPSNASAPDSGILRVDLRELKTGIEMRDEHMRERHLHTEIYPYAYFRLSGVSELPSIVRPDTTYTARASGEFYIHGHKRVVTPSLEIRLHNIEHGLQRLVVRARFTLNLDSFKIERPKALFLKLAETIDVEVIFASVNELTRLRFELPDWPSLP